MSNELAQKAEGAPPTDKFFTPPLIIIFVTVFIDLLGGVLVSV